MKMKKTDEINWTIVLTVSAIAIVLALLGPISWRASARATEQEMKLVMVWVLVLVSVSVFGAFLIGVMNAFSRMTLRHLEQDDRDEARKVAQQTENLVKAIIALSSQSQGADLTALLRASGNGAHNVRDVTDVNME
jgi:heme/copper-type cytochrome/quinol oxidase subunit 2